MLKTNMKNMQYIMIIGMCMLMCLSLSGCTAKGNTTENKSSLIQQKVSIETDVEAENIRHNENGDNIDTNADIFIDETQYALEENMLEAGTEIIYDDISYQVLETEITNQFGNRNIENLDDVGLMWADENGNLTGDNKYVFIKLRFTNKSDEEKEISRNAGRVVAINQDREIFYTGTEVVYIDQLWTKGKKSETYHYVLKPNESVESEIAFILLPNEYNYSTSDELFYLIGDTGEFGNVINRYVKLEE